MSEEQRRVALVVVAHPDDAEFGCAGTVAAWVREGWAVYYLIVTDASGGGSDTATEVGLEARLAITATRKAEQRAAATILGLKDVIFLDYPDGRIEPSLELRRDIVRVLRQVRPTRVICQSPERVWSPVYFVARHHPDHLAVAQATLAAIYPAAQNPWDFPELLAEGLPPHRVPEIYVVGPPLVNHAVDITETIDLKLAALFAHDSQVGQRQAEVEQLLRSRNAEAGARHGLAYAEEFHRIQN